MAPAKKTKQLAIRLTTLEAQVVSDVAEETGLTWSDVMRQALRNLHAERFKVLDKPKRKR